MTILVIDDDLWTRETLTIGLQRLGGQAVSTAATGIGGLALADAAVCDVILVDLILPDMSGLDVIRELRRTQSARAATYIVTGHASMTTAAEAQALGALDYLVKPIDIEALLRILQSDYSAAVRATD